eukprot:GHRR01017621.1.p1 GENE.GHRR01017621.1~~GHRR01017621.1.p1  ORF type:complete len:200 (+),score=58.63 GHRR01017621.1:183-782(+)
MGLMLAANCMTEVPAFHFQSAILARLPVPWVFNASMLLLAVRLAGYGCLPWVGNAWAVLGLELLHGVTFATSWGAGIVHCKRLVPPHLNASMQGLFSSLYGGIGSGLGALLGGFVMEALGGQQLFFICSLVVLGGWLLGLMVELLVSQAAKRQQGGGKRNGVPCRVGSRYAKSGRDEGSNDKQRLLCSSDGTSDGGAVQ